MPTLLFKYIIIGNTAVGKSAILLQFTERQFRDAHDMTIGVEFGAKDVSIGDAQVKLEIWDTAGQESFLSITRSYYRGTDGCLLVFDITDRASFDALPRWLDEARTNSANPDLSVMLIANKADLAEKRCVTTAEAQTFAEKHGLLFMEMSARNSAQVEQAFIGTAERCKANRLVNFPTAVVKTKGHSTPRVKTLEVEELPRFMKADAERIFSDLEAHPRNKPSGIQLKSEESMSASSKFKAECCEGV